MRTRLSSTQQIILSFLVVILSGSFLLNTNMAQLESSTSTYFDHLFTAVSMVCVTGLFTHPVVETYTIVGQIVCILLMQIGGLGLMTLIAIILIGSGRRLARREQLVLTQAINRETLSDFKPYLWSIVKYTFVIEALGMFFLSLRFVPQFGLGRGLFNALFVAVSGFTNAGFDNFSTYSLLDYASDPIVSLTVPALIILGGIGFSIWFDLKNTYKDLEKFSLKVYFRRLQTHTKLVFVVTSFFITVGTILALLLEHDTGLAHLNWGGKVLAAFFQSVTMRTAGFATVDFIKMHSGLNLVYVFLMFVGGSPGGTAGGVKTTTIALVFLFVLNHLKGRKKVTIFKHTINPDNVRNALNVFFIYLLVYFVALLALTIVEPTKNFLSLAFETISALSTVGVTINLTPSLSKIAQTILMFLMFMGRVGPITLLLSFTKSRKERELTYTESHILIG